MRHAKRLVYFPLLCGFLLVFGCASTEHSDAESPSVSVSFEEFTNGIAKPVIELMTVSYGFYQENSSWPQSLPALQRFAENKKLSFHAQDVKYWQVSDLSQETDITFQIVSPASFDASGKITTIWKMAQNKSAPDNIALTTLSRFCVLHQQQDSIGDIFLRLTMSVIVRQPLSEPNNKWCFAPPTENSRMKQHRDHVKEKLHRMQQQRQESQNQLLQ